MQPNFHLAAEAVCPGCQIGPIVVTNSMVIMLVVMIALLLVAWLVRVRLSAVPGGLQNAVEMIMETLEEVVQPALGKYATRLFPLMASFFIFILFANWFSLLPLVGTIGYIEGEEGHRVLVPFLRPATADLNMTLALAIAAFFVIHVSGVSVHGPLGHLKALSHNVFLAPVFVVIELFVIVSLSFRLFGNLFAGEVLIGMASWILPVVGVLFLVLELLFGLIQATIFTMLTLSFTSVSISGAEEHG